MNDVGPGWTERIAAAKILGMDYIGSGGLASPGIGTYAEHAGAPPQTLNRLGKESVEAGVGPVYIHNHTGEFDHPVRRQRRAEDRVADHHGAHRPALRAAEIDVFWASDAYHDITGTQSRGLINQFPTRVKLLHIKDGINVDEPPPAAAAARLRHRRDRLPPDLRGRQEPRPVLPPRAGRRHDHRRRHQLHEPQGHQAARPRRVTALLALPTSFPSVAAGTPAAANVVPVARREHRRRAADHHGRAIAADDLDVGAATAADFAVVSQNCSAPARRPAGRGQARRADDPATPANEAAPPSRAAPASSTSASSRRARTTRPSPACSSRSSPDGATEAASSLLAGKSTRRRSQARSAATSRDARASARARSAASARSSPAVARNYETALGRHRDGHRRQRDAVGLRRGHRVPGHLVNGTFALPRPLNVRALNARQPNPAYARSAETTGTPQALLTYAGPDTSDAVTLGFRQAIGATDVLRAGSYSKTLTFTLSTTTP